MIKPFKIDFVKMPNCLGFHSSDMTYMCDHLSKTGVCRFFKIRCDCVIRLGKRND